MRLFTIGHSNGGVEQLLDLLAGYGIETLVDVRTAPYSRFGILLTISTCQPSADAGVWRAQRKAWLAHLRRAYTPARAAAVFDAWADEDVYVPLDAELALMRRGGFRVEVLWRRGAFAVLRAAR